jgi:hypothetical protein
MQQHKQLSNYLNKLIQLLTSDAATGFTLCEGSVTLNNRCCQDQIRQKQINQIASTQISCNKDKNVTRRNLTLKAYRGFPGSSLYASTIA